jgi:alkanesulfonate monooxygenase SsuD/methylene tetrahydromethanopterin reductase-like flavin-dependent oxidoreductase (luciferase family)
MPITKFDSLYAGHVDMDNVGYKGTPVNDRRFSNDHLCTAFDKMTALAKQMDSGGYDTLWMAEHHFQPEGYECLPNIVLLGVHLSHLTQNLRIGCGFNIAPMWHPLRLAEDWATADVLTNGRVTFGVGRGYHTREVESFGAPLLDQESNRELFEEQVEIIFKAFNNESFSHKGKNYTIPPEVPYRGYDLKEITLVPRPKSLPIECWQPIQSGSERALNFMAKHNISGVIGGGSAEGGAMNEIIEKFQKAYQKTGQNIALGEKLSIGYHFFIDDSKEQALKAAAEYYEENLKMFAPLRLVKALSDQQIEDMSNSDKAPTAGLPTIEDAERNGGFLAGPADLIIEKLKQLEQKYPGLERIGVSLPMGTPQNVLLEQMQKFSEQVMPAFKNLEITSD